VAIATNTPSENDPNVLVKVYAICYQGKPMGDSELNVHGFVDTDWDGDMDRWWSTSGYVFKNVQWRNQLDE
jgi:hypothetical protein